MLWWCLAGLAFAAAAAVLFVYALCSAAAHADALVDASAESYEDMAKPRR